MLEAFYQGAANVFFKVSDSKYFRLCGHIVVCRNRTALSLELKVAVDHTGASE